MCYNWVVKYNTALDNFRDEELINRLVKVDKDPILAVREQYPHFSYGQAKKYLITKIQSDLFKGRMSYLMDLQGISLATTNKVLRELLFAKKDEPKYDNAIRLEACKLSYGLHKVLRDGSVLVDNRSVHLNVQPDTVQRLASINDRLHELDRELDTAPLEIVKGVEVS